MPSALIVEDDASSRQALVDFVRTEGFEPTAVDSVRDALTAISAEPDVVLCDLVLPDGLGTELLPAVRERPLMEFVFVTGKATVESAIEALRGGASDYLKKPVDVRRLKALLANVRRRLDLQAEIVSLRGELRDLGRFGELIGASSVMQETYTLIERVAPTSAPVFLSGESGTGKELTALTLHRLSQRRGKTFLPINCGAISPTLMESELFGHEKGSFTGAGRQHRGYFERASGGTLFLDEISEMSLELQVKLLRVLETGALSRVGGDRTVPVDVRIVAASNRNPEQAIADGRLREDLYYRLNVFPIRLPPVRDRVGDVELLAESFLVRLNRGEGRQKRFSAAALVALARYEWAGIVR